MKKIGIIGSGIVAQTLGSGFLAKGHEVMLGSRDVNKLDAWKEKNAKGKTGTFEDAAVFGDIIVLSVKGLAASDAIEQAGVQNFNSKTVIDTTNPTADAPPENGVLKFFTTLDESLMEQLQERFPAAHFVKAFNSVGNAYMINPAFTEKPSMFICGNNDTAKKEVSDILVGFGWEVEDMGKVEASRAIEPLCMLWCIPGMLNNKWNHAFRLIKA
ncbi:MAG: NAD(P)-binding domain-containing protein [Flavipsychrobacter sp.]|nr:NAD(P)-binding domain-containing protein [Flavipsychrobacter sp.]